MRDQQILDLWQSYNSIYSNITESHFKVGDEVVCKASGMEGEVVKVDPEEKGKYYTVKREDGKTMKYAPDELKIEKEEDEKEDVKEAKNGGVPKKKEEKFHTKLDKLVHNTFGSSPEEKKMKEEVEIAAQYFYEMGLNEDGVNILIEELGEEEFANFVYDISEEYVLTEARAGGVRIEPVTAKGQKFKSGKPTGKSLQRLRDQKAARKEAESKASASKPSGMKTSLQRQSAVAAAAKKQPKKPGVLDRIAGAVNRGIERHNAAMSAAKETGKVIRKAAGKVGGVAKEVGKGASGAAKLAGHVARKGLNDEYVMGYLIDEGYADTNQAALAIVANMSEEWKQDIVEAAKDQSNKQIEKGVKTTYKAFPAL